MFFSDAIKEAAFKRAGGQCECTQAGHLHKGRCPG